MKIFELKLSTGKWVIWSGKDGIDACWNYAYAHPGVAVVAWRNYPQHGFFPYMLPIVQ